MKTFAALGLIIMGLGLTGCQRQQTEVISTAQDNVQVLDATFVIPELERTRKVRVYLPPGYTGSDTQYPVLYMHDGQNLFDDATAYAGEWRVDETLNRLAASHDLQLIVVGIDNGGDMRMQELSPWTNPDFGQAQGQQYLNFILEVVKPYIDNRFRTLPDAENTGIMGSSMGGLMSHYAALEKPQVFAKVGVFSPSFWFSGDVFGYTSTRTLDTDSRWYFLVGDKEGDGMVENTERMVRLMSSLGLADTQMSLKVVEGAEHNEAFWAAEFEQAVLWLFYEN